MRKGLLVTYNSYLFVEFLSIKKDFYDVVWDCYIPKDYYPTSERYNSFKSIVNKTIERRGVFQKIVEETEQKYDVILCPSNFTDNIGYILRRHLTAEIVYYENGISDYVSASICKRNPDLFLNKVKYMRYPTLVNNEFYSSIKRIDLPLDYFMAYEQYLPYKYVDFFKPEAVALLFSKPLDYDFGYFDYYEDFIRFIENTYSGKTIAVKKHPRDTNNYHSDKVNIINIDQDLPGEVATSMYYKCEHVYVYPSTVMLNEPGKYKLLQFPAEKMTVNSNVFEKIYKKKLIKGNKNIELIRV